ncbi:gluconate 2-dehydrogenase subunit 3-like protein [Thermosporothrix hazakensis]|jgi:hypothetical protein|uniref:Gluconate 2-dehydrogenase subunit 3-like protein n=2 Tax=Thermosporothrix TaxID=768650 RepID=A0A326UPA6_THEHA|nr:gluconate 2-dehydrogenase subunit 3 family protein [Thermosporothrix hazakensis]PZW36059.1 gluconate 2-dehydrogenase subunit 3-like protein [Thermosporothrix hazakensis]BBH88525.1 hypothetical protein KTC_32760 [Thermosporothrix sp. COM3]GCE46710.1 hypothetical protein KTH_15790 [Thermosporothrix hazakensis]
MRETYRGTPTLQRRHAELSFEERAQLNAVIDLLIPSDGDFPPPSSLHLIDELLIHLHPCQKSQAPRMLTVKRLRLLLHELNISAGGDFCRASPEKQQSLLKQLEWRNPAFFQELWTLANHSYYTRLAYLSGSVKETHTIRYAV